MDITDIVEVATVGLATLAAINQLGLPALTLIGSNLYKHKEGKNVDLTKYSDLSPKLTSTDYLVLSAHLYEFKQGEEGDCKDYSRGVLSLYSELTEINNRPDLKKKVRLAGAIFDHGAHNYIEEKVNENWLPFEPQEKIQKGAVELLVLEHAGEGENYWGETAPFRTPGMIGKPTVIENSLPASRFTYPTLSSLLFKGGIANLTYRHIRKKTLSKT
jgi:hypothetical protein